MNAGGDDEFIRCPVPGVSPAGHGEKRLISLCGSLHRPQEVTGSFLERVQISEK
jgi:hypothetical protein